MPHVTRRGHGAFGNSYDLAQRATHLPEDEPPTVKQTRRMISELALRMHETGERPTPEQMARMEAGLRQARADVKVPPQHVPHSVVYYMRVGNRIKIGYTQNLEGRMRGLAPEELLGYERGDTTLEHLRHRQFNAHHVAREWFEDCPAIRAHIAKINDAE